MILNWAVYSRRDYLVKSASQENWENQENQWVAVTLPWELKHTVHTLQQSVALLIEHIFSVEKLEIMILMVIIFQGLPGKDGLDGFPGNDGEKVRTVLMRQAVNSVLWRQNFIIYTLI